MEWTFYENNRISDKSGKLYKKKNIIVEVLKGYKFHWIRNQKIWHLQNEEILHKISLISKLTKNDYLVWANALWRKLHGGSTSCRVPRRVARFRTSRECQKNDPYKEPPLNNNYW